MYKQSCTVQTHVIQRSTVYDTMSILLRLLTAILLEWLNLGYTFEVKLGSKIPVNSPLATYLGVKFS